MLEAGVDLVTVGVFSWAHLEVAPGEYRFGWLDDVLERLAAAGIGIDLATATASPPPWLTARHPEMLPVSAPTAPGCGPAAGRRFCPSSPVYREHAVALCRALAERYARTRGLRLWHVGNELGCHNALCYCDVSAAAFRAWLRRRYGDVDRLNDAWGTAFWSQRYTDFERGAAAPHRRRRSPTPRSSWTSAGSPPTSCSPTSSPSATSCTSSRPGSRSPPTSWSCEHSASMDYWAWAREVDVVSNDHYLDRGRPRGHRELAFCADLTRGLAGGGPWLLMETSPSAVNWQPRNIARRPGELLRSADPARRPGRRRRSCSSSGGPRGPARRSSTPGWCRTPAPTRGCGARSSSCGASWTRWARWSGSRVRNDVAMLFDWHAWWGCELDSHPSVDVTYLDRAHALHRSLTDAGVGVDLVHPEADLAATDLVLVPTLYSVTDAAVGRLREAVEGGATALVTYFSGIVDEHDHIRLGGYPGAFRDLLGIRVEEFLPLRSDERVRLDNGWSADVWTEDLHLRGRRAVATYVDGPAAGQPGADPERVRRRARLVPSPAGPTRPATDALVGQLLAEAGVEPVGRRRPVRRRGHPPRARGRRRQLGLRRQPRRRARHGGRPRPRPGAGPRRSTAG